MSDPTLERLRDPGRLDALAATGLAPGAREPNFDRLTRLVARLLAAPVALVSLVDPERQFFPSSLGLPEPWASRGETPLSHSFCKYVVASGEPLVVEDARSDPLVRDNGAVEDLGVVAYLGVPIRAPGGQVLGSFCAIDSRPRSWSDEERSLLGDLAGSLASEIALRCEREALRHAEARLSVQHGASQVLAEAPTLAEAILRVLRMIGEQLDLDVGEFWAVDAEAGRLRRTSVGWSSRRVGDAFAEGSRSLSFVPGEGLPGRAWDRLATVWVADVAEDPEFCRTELAAAHGLRGAIAVPVMDEAGLVGVMTLLTRHRLDADEPMIGTLASVGRQLGQFATRRSAEAEVGTLNARLATILDAASHVAIIATDEHGRITTFNAGAEQMLGYTRDEVVGQMTPEAFHLTEEMEQRARELPPPPGGWPGGFEAIVAPVRGGGHDQRLWTYVRKDRGRLTVDLTVSAVRDPSGRVLGYLGIARDVTRDREVERQLRRFAALVEHSGDFIAITDLEGRVEYLNPAGRALVGDAGSWPPRGTVLLDYLEARTWAQVLAEALPAARTDGAWAGEGALRHARTGEPIRVDLSLFQVRDRDSGEPICLAAIARDVSDRKRAEREQLELVALVENSNDLIGTAEPDGRLRFLNRAGRRMLGLPEEGPLPCLVDESNPGAAGSLFSGAALEAALASGRWDGPGHLRHFGNGERIETQASLFLLRRPETGEPMCLATVQRDVTRERRDATRLRDSEARIRAILDSSLDALITIDHHGLVVEFNPAAERIFGHTRGQALGRTLADLIVPPELRAAHVEGLRRYLETGHGPVLGRLVQVPAVRADGTRFPVELAITVTKQDGPPLFTASLRDISERKRAEDMLLESEERFRSSFENAPIGMGLVNPDGRWLRVNRALCEILGRSESELLATDFQSITHPEDLRMDVDLVRRTLDGSIDGYQIEKRYVHRNGHLVWVLLSVSLVRDSEQGPLYFVTQIQDVTRRKQIEEDLRRAKEEAVAASRAKSEFLANMSHEVRTPIAAVLGYADMLLDPELSPGERDRALQSIRRNSTHLLQLINDILDLSKIEAGRMDLDPIPYPPWQVVLEVVSALRVRADERQIRLEVRPTSPIPAVVIMDATRVRQVLVNLVGNAVKFSEPGGRVSIRVSAAEVADHAARLRIEVEDRGIGMTREQLGQIFQPFRQADSSTTRRFGGTGLGLSITRSLVETMGGSIEARSELGRGSCFAVELPLAVQGGGWIEPADLPALAAPEPRAGDAKPRRKLRGRVLLAEDSPDNRRVMIYHLGRLGLEVEVAEDGAVAVERARRRPPDLILMDMQMPELDGYGATSSLRRGGYTGPIVALTAHAMREDREKCLRAGCTEYLTKPVEPRVLADTLARYLPEAGPTPAAATGEVPVPLAAELPADRGLAALVRQYALSLPGRVAELRASLESGAFGRVATLAHQTRGVGGMYGFPALTEAAGLIEDAVREGRDADLIRELIEEFAAEVDAIGRAPGPGG